MQEVHRLLASEDVLEEAAASDVGQLVLNVGDEFPVVSAGDVTVNGFEAPLNLGELVSERTECGLLQILIGFADFADACHEDAEHRVESVLLELGAIAELGQAGLDVAESGLDFDKRRLSRFDVELRNLIGLPLKVGDGGFEDLSGGVQVEDIRGQATEIDQSL